MHLDPFKNEIIERNKLEELIRISDVLEIESDSVPFNHNLDQLDIV